MTMRFLSKFCFFFVTTYALFSQERPPVPTKIDFAQFLEADGNLDEAFIVWNEILFFSPNQEGAITSLLALARLEFIRENFAQSLKYSRRLMQIERLPPEVFDWSRFSILLNLWQLGSNPLMFPDYQSLVQSQSKFEPLATAFSGYYLLRSGFIDEAKKAFASSNHPLALSGMELVTNWNTLPRVSPWLTASASALIPGLGQSINGHFVDGAQAFFFVGLFSGTTYLMYTYESQITKTYPMTIISGLFALTFYLSNIYGAYQTAEFRNKRMETDLVLPWYNAFEIEFLKSPLNQ